MTSEQIKKWKELVQSRLQGWIPEDEHWQKYLRNRPWAQIDDVKNQTLIATLENAYQTARLYELLEGKAVKVTITTQQEGRLFKEDS